MPRLLPSPTAPLLHRIPGGVNFPRVADSPTPPSPTVDDSSPPSSPGAVRQSASPGLERRSRTPRRSPGAARRRRNWRRSLDRSFAVDIVDDEAADELTSPASPGGSQRQQPHRQLPYVNSLPRGQHVPVIQQLVVVTQSDDDDDDDWC